MIKIQTVSYNNGTIVSRLSNLPQVDLPYPSMICQPPLQLPVSKNNHLWSPSQCSSSYLEIHNIIANVLMQKPIASCSKTAMESLLCLQSFT